MQELGNIIISKFVDTMPENILFCAGIVVIVYRFVIYLRNRLKRENADSSRALTETRQDTRPIIINNYIQGNNIISSTGQNICVDNGKPQVPNWNRKKHSPPSKKHKKRPCSKSKVKKS